MWISQENLPSSKTLISTAATLTATAVIFRTIVNDILPDSLRLYGTTSLRRLSARFSSTFTVVIDEFDGLTPNQLFDAANVYLAAKISPATRRIKINKLQKEKHFTIAIDKNQEILDSFKGVDLSWILISNSSRNDKSNRNLHKSVSNSKSPNEVRFFELSFHKKYNDIVLESYLPYILQESIAMKEERKTLKLHTVDYNGTDYWSCTKLDHPATFETMAIEPETKKELIDDLELFLSRKEYYRRVGKAWKRGYLLYGPPGTGKSSLVAAMANYLKFDVYDLDLKEIQCNSDLRRLLIGTGNRSILVIEDIDCSVELQNRSLEKEATFVEDDKVTLSGLLNFIDGLWSSCGDERIIVLTTNHKDRLDPALLRPGRMDIQIHLSYCSFNGFKILASNYLGIQEHPLFGDIKDLLKKTQATPAEVAGELMKTNDIGNALAGLVKFVEGRKNETWPEQTRPII